KPPALLVVVTKERSIDHHSRIMTGCLQEKKETFRLQCGCHLGLRLTEYSKLNHDYSLEENGRVQSCNDNHLLLGANCEEDHPLMKSYSNHLKEEMEQIEG
ncbi:hypothetical protein pdam_00009802, partial [Pocillopora damicornis]